MSDVVEGFELRPLVLEGPEETFHNSVVVAASGTTHGAGHVESFQSLLVVVAGVLRAAIAVMKKPVRARFPRFSSVTKSRTDQRRGETFGNRPTDNLATEQVQDNTSGLETRVAEF